MADQIVAVQGGTTRIKYRDKGGYHAQVMDAFPDPSSYVSKHVRVTSTQTGSDVWSPASGKKIAVTNLVVSVGGTTAGRVTLWFGANADTTYTDGTDATLFDAEFIPSATVAPGAVLSFPVPFFCNTADYELHLTTSAAMTVIVTVSGYEY